MHPNPTFRGVPSDHSVNFARDRGFGTLCLNGDEGPILSHVPFILSEDGKTADLHLVRSNPIARMGGGAAVIAVSGPDGYISPDWYGVDDQVPTWNYVAVHLRGTLSPLPQDTLAELLDRQSAHFESRLLPKPAWMPAKMTPEVLGKMMRAILPFRMNVTKIDSTWKLGQNKPEQVRLAAADKVETGLGAELAELAALMRDPIG